jgi:hypothetical protein
MNQARTHTPVHLWIVGIIALLWNSFGAFDYVATHYRMDFYMSQFSAEQLAYFYGFPAWATAAWAIAIWTSVAGSVGLLLRKAWAVPMFAISLVALIISTIYNLGLSNGAEIMGAGGVAFSAVIWIVAGFLLFYSRAQKSNGALQ